MNIFLIGTYSSLNKGDFAMHQALINEVSRRLKEVVFSILSLFPKLDKERYSSYFHRYPEIRCEKNLLISPTFNARSNLMAYVGVPSPLLKNCDFVIDVSGDAVGETYGFKNTIYRISYLNLIKNLKKKLIFAPQSLGPFTYSKFVFKRLLTWAEIVCARDSLSYRYLYELGLDNFLKSADLAFLLNQRESNLNKKYLEEIRHQNGTKIGLNLSFLMERYVSWSGHKSNVVELGVKLCKKMWRTFGDVTLIFIPHVFGPEKSKDDRMVGKMIYERLSKGSKRKFILVEEEMTHEEIKAIILDLDLFIGSRMHACIGSASVGTPFINIAYSDKSLGLVRDDFELPMCQVDIRNIKDEQEFVHKILAHVKFALSHKEEIKETLRSKSFKFGRMAEKSIDEICEILKD